MLSKRRHAWRFLSPPPPAKLLAYAWQKSSLDDKWQEHGAEWRQHQEKWTQQQFDRLNIFMARYFENVNQGWFGGPMRFA